MKVRCEIVESDSGYEGVIINAQGVVVYKTDFEPCAEDTDAMMAAMILRNGWKVVRHNTPLEDMQ